MALITDRTRRNIIHAVKTGDLCGWVWTEGHLASKYDLCRLIVEMDYAIYCMSRYNNATEMYESVADELTDCWNEEE